MLYGQAVIDLLAPTLGDLITKYEDQLNAVIRRDVEETLGRQPNDSPERNALQVVNWAIDTFLGSAQEKLEDSVNLIIENAKLRTVRLTIKNEDMPPTLQ